MSRHRKCNPSLPSETQAGGGSLLGDSWSPAGSQLSLRELRYPGRKNKAEGPPNGKELTPPTHCQGH